MKYGFEKCDKCAVTWRVCIDGRVQIVTNTCAATDVCVSCLEKYAKLGKAAEAAHAKADAKAESKKERKQPKSKDPE